MQAPSVSAYFVNAALEKLQHQPALVARLLHDTGIDPATLALKGARVAGEQFSNLVRDIMFATGDEQMGHGSAPQPLGSWATMTQLCLGADTLGEALRRLARFYRLIPWGIHTRLESGEAETAFVMARHSDHAFSPYLFESFLFYVYRYSNWLINKQIPLLGVDFSFAETAQHSEYRRLFLCQQFNFNAPHSQLRFASRYLEEPVRQDAHSLKKFLEHTNLAMVAQTQLQSSWQRRVQGCLKEHLSENPQIEDVAKQLEVHPHTLRRQLQREGGIQFKDVKAQLRNEIAIELLSGQRLNIEAIALALGFSETSAFSRAFKKWTGMSPLNYRQRQG